uniref:Alpha/beta hydrolase fold-5 domain-containing protein n=1 Tax=Leptocylindrus danicus TaxID=163516 RepID=A0A7S2PDM3_9STRA|mmetsp:Transcript_3023/g.4369  ORF Transcript_3023/g.4369 Transcript_3023/m.4369 type:complete len:246 (+) Transcript_3023:136-873(+)
MQWPALEEAAKLHKQLVKDGRIVIEKKYDLYLPPIASSSPKSCDKDVGFIYIPGALIDHVAYSSVAAKLSHKGAFVAVLNLEPTRLATDESVSVGDISKMMEDINVKYGVSRWVLGGHSLGAFHACTLIQEHYEILGVSKLVLMGMYNAYSCDLSEIPVNVLIIHASEDGFKCASKKDEKEFQAKMPPSLPSSGGFTIYKMIQGGNHTSFASYPHQTFPKMDGNRLISLEEQHNFCVEWIFEFLS